MDVLVTIVTVLQVLCGLVVIIVVLSQTGKNSGLSGVIGGATEGYLAKAKSKSWDARLARATKWVGAAFVLLTLVLTILSKVAAGASAE